MIEISERYILIPVLKNMAFIQGHICLKKQKLLP